jgi:hypothetical protein
MSEMIERVAEKIHYAGCSAGLWPIASWGLHKWHNDKVREVAREAIQAMREPTEAMVASGIARVEECTSGWSCVAPCSAEHAWQAMINAALDEQEGGE